MSRPKQRNHQKKVSFKFATSLYSVPPSPPKCLVDRLVSIGSASATASDQSGLSVHVKRELFPASRSPPFRINRKLKSSKVKTLLNKHLSITLVISNKFQGIEFLCSNLLCRTVRCVVVCSSLSSSLFISHCLRISN